MADDLYDSVKSPVVRRMLRNFQLAEDAESENRARGLKALEFRRGGKAQWDQDIYQLRLDDKRPRESYNQIPQFIHQVTNDMRMNMAQTRYVPGEDATKEVAEVYEDLVRNIQSQSEAEVAYDCAADSQVTIGWGYWRYLTEYENPKTFDQIIKVNWVPNTFTVYDDPYAIQQDKLDRRFLIQVSDIRLTDFNSDYDKDYDSGQLETIGSSQPQWATQNTVRVAEYWELTESKSMLYRNKKSGEISPTKPKDMNNYDSREVSEPKVMWYKCTALEELEKREWPGIFIPYVYVAGEETNIDGQWYRSGLVENMMGTQKQYNYWTNAATELVALAPKSPFIGPWQSFEGFEKFWDNANNKNYPWLPYNPTSKDGKVIAAPQRAQNSADISSMIALVQQAQNNFYTTTGIYPASLGKSSNETSGKAINARKVEGDTANFHFPDNMARAQRAGGRILEDLIKKIYDGSRTINGTKEDKSTRTIKINQKFQDESGQEKEFDLTTGTYGVMVTTGPSYTTKRQEAAESMTAIVQAAPELMQIAGDLVVSSYDWPGADKMAERIKKTLPPQLQDDPNLKDVPPQIQAQLAQQGQALEQSQQIIQQGAQELQSLQQQVEDKQAENQLKAMDIQSKVQIEEMKAEIEQKRIALEEEKIRLEVIKAQMPQSAGTAQSGGSDSRNVMQARLMDMDELEAKQAAEQEELMHKEQMQTEQQMFEAQMAEEKDNREEQRAAALMSQLSNIQASVTMLANAVAAPRVIVRDPKTGLAKGVANAANG